MKPKIITLVGALILLGHAPLQATTWWDTGHHVIDDGDVYGEVFLENDASVDVLGGSILKLETFNVSTADIFGGEMDSLWTNDDTVASIYGGTLEWLAASENSTVNLYAYDITYYPTDGLHSEGWLEGTYYSDDTQFSFSFYGEYSYSHVNVVPEPATFVLFGLGLPIVRPLSRRIHNIKGNS